MAEKKSALASVRPGDNTEIPLGMDAIEPSFSLADRLADHGLDVSQYDDFLSAAESTKRFRSPFTWPLLKKARVLFGALIASILAAGAAGSYAMPAQILMHAWGISERQYNVGITIFLVGFLISPMILAPVSETYGRYWVFVGAGVVLLAGSIACAVTNSLAGMLVARFVTGNGAALYATLTGGLVADLFHKEDRNAPMAIFACAIFTGSGVGPLFAGVVVDNLEWRWVFYLQAIAVGALGLYLVTFDETRGNVLLERKCKALNKIAEEIGTDDTSGEPRASIHFEPSIVKAPTSIGRVIRSFAFPMKLLLTESVVFWFSLWLAFAWSILYMQFNSLGLVFSEVYGFTKTQIGLVFLAIVIGALIATTLCIVQDTLFRRLWPDRMATPEGRLQSACFESLLFPIGMFWFGATARADISWVSPTLAIGVSTVGIYTIYLAVSNYFADVYHEYSSSAQAAQSMCRNVMASAYPLFTTIMFHNLGIMNAAIMLGSIGTALTAVPWILTIFGARIRQRSPFACDLAAKEEGETS